MFVLSEYTKLAYALYRLAVEDYEMCRTYAHFQRLLQEDRRYRKALTSFARQRLSRFHVAWVATVGYDGCGRCVELRDGTVVKRELLIRYLKREVHLQLCAS